MWHKIKTDVNIDREGGIRSVGNYVLSILGVLSVLYGILILQVGSGTFFWMVWEAIGFFFFIWAVLSQNGFFAAHKEARILFHIFVAVTVAVLVMLCGLIAGEFTAGGQQNLDYIIVLGAQVREDGPSVVLSYRLDTAIDYLNENPDTICIVSGGQGKFEIKT